MGQNSSKQKREKFKNNNQDNFLLENIKTKKEIKELEQKQIILSNTIKTLQEEIQNLALCDIKLIKEKQKLIKILEKEIEATALSNENQLIENAEEIIIFSETKKNKTNLESDDFVF